jgi:hypothetical protein
LASSERPQFSGNSRCTARGGPTGRVTATIAARSTNRWVCCTDR